MNKEIKTLAGIFKNELELQAYCDAQYKTLERSFARIKELEEQLDQMRSMLTSTVPLIPDKEESVQKLNVSPEQAICEMQITKLQRTAMDRELTLEETKRLDLLIKNLYLAKNQTNSIVADFTKLPSSITEADLVQLAAESLKPEKVEEWDGNK